MNKKHDATQTHRGAAHAAPYPLSRLSAPIELVDLAAEIAKADAVVNVRVNAQLQVIADQIKALQAQARAILESARQDQDLHRAQCHFKRLPGKVYHLYRRTDGKTYFSMLSPAEWGDVPPDEFVGSYRLEADMGWTPAANAAERNSSHGAVQRLLALDNDEAMSGEDSSSPDGM